MLVAPGFNVNVPLDRWRQVQAFDTARECEDEKARRWSQALNEVANQLPYPPYPEPPKAEAPLQGQTAPKEKKPQEHRSLLEKMREVLEEDLKEMTDEQRQKEERARQEWRKETDKIDAAREPKQREINERYRHWKCVPADAVYQAPK